MESWFVVHTKPKQEFIAEANLQRQGFQVYLPRIKQSRRRHGKWVDTIEPLFPRYLFIRLFLTRDDTSPIRSTRGVVGLVRFTYQPAVVPNSIVEGLQDSVDEETGCHHFGQGLFSQGDTVSIIQGPLAGLKGIFQNTEIGDGRVIVLMNLLGKENRVTVARDQITPVCL